MSSCAVTREMRAAGWNIGFTLGVDIFPKLFAGIYQVPGSDLMTFRDVCNELRLCFGLPNCNVAPQQSSSNDSFDPWADVAFELTDCSYLNPQEVLCTSLVTGDLLDKPISTHIQPTHPQQRDVVIYRIVHHNKNCELPPTSSRNHVEARCLWNFNEPVVRRFEPRYLPPNEKPSDPALKCMPLGRQLKPRPLTKRLTSSMQSLSDVEDIEFKNTIAPKGIDYNEAKRLVTEFRQSCLQFGTRCAISGEGEPWCPNLPAGPGIKACHIIPPTQYHLYPSGRNDDNVKIIAQNPDRLQEAWRNTWDARLNGILMMGDLYTSFNARLFSINPVTLRIRVPYDALTNFNGKRALVPLGVDRNALCHHYAICCLENMGAVTYSYVNPPSTSSESTSASSASSPSISTPCSGDKQMETVIHSRGDNPEEEEEEEEEADAAQEARYKRRRLEYDWSEKARSSLSVGCRHSLS